MSIDKPAAIFVSLIRVVAGFACIAGGSALTVLLWKKGYLWGPPVVLAVIGVCLFIPGLVDLRNQWKRRKCRESIRGSEESLIRGMLDVKRRGKNPLQWLREEGIQDAEVRAELLRAMNERWKSGRASE